MKTYIKVIAMLVTASLCISGCYQDFDFGSPGGYGTGNGGGGYRFPPALVKSLSCHLDSVGKRAELGHTIYGHLAYDSILQIIHVGVNYWHDTIPVPNNLGIVQKVILDSVQTIDFRLLPDRAPDSNKRNYKVKAKILALKPRTEYHFCLFVEYGDNGLARSIQYCTTYRLD